MSSVLRGDFKMPDEKEFQSLDRLNDENIYCNIEVLTDGCQFETKDGIIPYGWNRVILANKIKGSDFINASWMIQRKEEGSYDLLRPFEYAPFEEASFIIAKAPGTKNLSAFHQMIGQEKLDIVISLVKNESKIKKKLGDVGSSIKMDRVSKKFISCEILNEDLYKIRSEIFCSFRGQKYNHQYTEFRFVNPTDLSSVEIIKSFLTMFCFVRQETKTVSQFPKILINDPECGCGLSGVVIVLYEILEKIDKALLANKEKRLLSKDDDQFINVHSAVSELILNRQHVINTQEKYEFIFKCIKYYSKNRETLGVIDIENAKRLVHEAVKELEPNNDVSYYLAENNPNCLYVNENVCERMYENS